MKWSTRKKEFKGVEIGYYECDRIKVAKVPTEKYSSRCFDEHGFGLYSLGQAVFFVPYDALAYVKVMEDGVW